VGGFLLLEEAPPLEERELTFEVKDITLLGTGFACVLASSKKVALHLATLLEAGQQLDHLRGLWHSHPGFAPNWSLADESGIRKLLQAGALGSTTPWALSLCASGVWINSRLDWLSNGQHFMSPLQLTNLPGLDPLWLEEVEKAIELFSSQPWESQPSPHAQVRYQPKEKEHLELWPEERLNLPKRYCPLRGLRVQVQACQECPLRIDCLDWLQEEYGV